MEQKRCFGCMREKRNSPICEYCGYDERTPNAPHQLPPGTVLNNQYIVGKALGQGGFGITYMGWDQFLSIPVAIKEFYPSGIVTRETTASTSVFLVTEQVKDSFVSNRDRFVREATSLARLGRNSDVGNIVHVQNLVQANNTAYIIMEYVEGIDLRRYIRNKGGKLSVEETFRLLLPVMESLEAVHENHIVHRDISPDNIMVMPNGKTKLIDFGAAHEVQQDVEGTVKSTEAILKHGFAPIEQYQRKGELGPWTDVYAMCATAYYCLTGKFPPHATDRMLGDEDFQWEDILGLSAGKRQALQNGTAIRRQERYQTMAQLRQALLAEETNIPSVMGTVSLEDAPTLPKVPPVYTAPVTPQAYTAPVTPKPAEAPYTAPVAQEEKTVAVETPVTQYRPRDGKKGLLMGLAALVVAAMAGFTFLKPEKTPEPQWVGNELMSWELQYPTYPSASGDALPVFGSNLKGDQIATVTFLDTLAQEPNNSWDVSENKDGTVKAWTKPNGELYDLYIAAEGGINAGKACEGMFYNYDNLETISFNGALHTEYTTDMSHMFYQCMSLRELDVSSFDTSNVTDMSQMFYFCWSLDTLDVSGFDTSKVTNMSYMFDRTGLEDISMPMIDISKVEAAFRVMGDGGTINGQPWESYFE